MGQFWDSIAGKRDQIDAADHLIFNLHHLFDLNLVKKNCRLWVQKASRAPRLFLLLDRFVMLLLVNLTSVSLFLQ